ncbi:MAG TPA: TadE/TadG family type IV pilus assembly protein [Polyangiaceae bacterium]|nr:TadE/TadG family type IV pilus assembly protein [Polyangiaceae bacterium]
MRLRSRKHERGAVYVEFLLAFVPVFILFLGVVQLSLVNAAQLVVREAAARACRTAIVILDDDPARHNTARGMLHGPPAPAGFFASIANALGFGSPPAPGPDGSRFAAIRAAAYVPLATLSPPTGWLLGALPADETNLEASVTGTAERYALGFAAYNRAGAIVTLREAPGSEELANDPIAPDATLTLHVTYLYYCAVPLVSGLMCSTLPNLLGGDAVRHALERMRAHPLDASQIMHQLQSDREKAQRLAHELARAENPAVLAPLMTSSGRFAVLEAEISLPNQGARYHGGYND